MNQLNRRRRSIAIVIILAVLAIALYFIAKEASTTTVQPTVQKINTTQKEPVKQDFEDASFEGNGKWYGLCAKNSIHSVEDFRKTVSSDPVLNKHFSGFKWENAKMGKLDKAMHAYVHYRKDDKIFRKKTPIKLPAGDGFITDGVTTVRTMCCNSYAAAPPAYAEPELEAEPAAGPQPINVNNYSAPPEPVESAHPEEVIERTLSSTNHIVPPGIIIPPSSPDEPRTPSHDDPKDKPDEPKEPPKPPKPVPINPAALLLGTGLITLIGLKKRLKK